MLIYDTTGETPDALLAMCFRAARSARVILRRAAPLADRVRFVTPAPARALIAFCDALAERVADVVIDTATETRGHSGDVRRWDGRSWHVAPCLPAHAWRDDTMGADARDARVARERCRLRIDTPLAVAISACEAVATRNISLDCVVGDGVACVNIRVADAYGPGGSRAGLQRAVRHMLGADCIAAPSLATLVAIVTHVADVDPCAVAIDDGARVYASAHMLGALCGVGNSRGGRIAHAPASAIRARAAARGIEGPLYPALGF